MTPSRSTRLAVPAALLAACLAACVPVREPGQEPAPQITESQLREKAKENYATGLLRYQQGEYEEAQKNLTAALDHGLLTKSEQSNARKHLAFMHCVSGRRTQCEDEFRKAMEIDPGFDLVPAEAGHPIWGPVYRNVRSQLAAASAPSDPRPKAPRTVAEQHLADGMAKYEAGEFNSAVKLFQSALKEGLTDKSDQVKAHKQSAFSLCLLRRMAPCRSEFMKIFEIDPAFDLAPAESGHPSWSKTYARAKQDARLAREKKDKAAKDKAAKDAPKKK